jgi:hydroxymethylglutaryl-CoA lyase
MTTEVMRTMVTTTTPTTTTPTTTTASDSYPHDVKIVEVGPRDGLQNEPQPVSTEDKVQLIRGLAKAGCSVIEAGAFVSPKWVPQMADSKQVFQALSEESFVGVIGKETGQKRPYFSCLVPNIKGLEQALQVRDNLDEVAIFGASSEAFSQRNIACSIDESLERFRSVVAMAREHDLPVRGYVSTVVGCPYQGEVAPAQVAKVVQQMLELGCYEISLGDTIGVGTPGSVRAMLEEVLVRTVLCISRLTGRQGKDVDSIAW